MPIKSLQTNRTPQFPCIGKLRKGGAKRQNAKGHEIMGVDLKHFRLTTDDADAAAAFANYYGPEPKSIDVFMPYATTNENFGAWLEEYTAGGLVRRCDGELQHFHRDADGKANTSPVKCERLCNRPCTCKQVGRLAVIVPQLARLAYVLVETHSLYDIMQLTENLQAAEALRGDLRGIPFILSRREREISTPGEGGKRSRRTKSLLFIEPNPEWVGRQLESMRLAALPIVDVPALQAPATRMIAGPVTIDGDTSDYDDEDEDTSALEEAQAALGVLLDELDDYGVQFYGLEKWDAERNRLASFASHGATEDVAKLDLKAIDVLIQGLKKRIAERAAAKQNGATTATEAQPEPEPAEIPA
jgi:hypothetical protein